MFYEVRVAGVESLQGVSRKHSRFILVCKRVFIYWRVNSSPTGDWRIGLHLRGRVEVEVEVEVEVRWGDSSWILFLLWTAIVFFNVWRPVE